MIVISKYVPDNSELRNLILPIFEDIRSEFVDRKPSFKSSSSIFASREIA